MDGSVPRQRCLHDKQTDSPLYRLVPVLCNNILKLPSRPLRKRSNLNQSMIPATCLHHIPLPSLVPRQSAIISVGRKDGLVYTVRACANFTPKIGERKLTRPYIIRKSQLWHRLLRRLRRTAIHCCSVVRSFSR